MGGATVGWLLQGGKVNKSTEIYSVQQLGPHVVCEHVSNVHFLMARLFFTKSHGVELATKRGVLDFWTPNNVETTLEKLLLHPIPGKARLPVADVIRILEDSQRRGSPPGFLGLGCVENLVK